jgi:hypothetical protein
MRAAFASLTALVAFAQTASAIAVYGQCGVSELMIISSLEDLVLTNS